MKTHATMILLMLLAIMSHAAKAHTSPLAAERHSKLKMQGMNYKRIFLKPDADIKAIRFSTAIVFRKQATRLSVMDRLIRSNLKLSFRVSKTLRLTISYL